MIPRNKSEHETPAKPEKTEPEPEVQLEMNFDEENVPAES